MPFFLAPLDIIKVSLIEDSDKVLRLSKEV